MAYENKHVGSLGSDKQQSHLNEEEIQYRPSFWTINRIGDETLRPRQFNESLPFTNEVPYRLTKRNVLSGDDVPLHYASSLEVVLYENVSGEIIVDDKHLNIEGSSVVVVPPGIVHGGFVTGTTGVIYCLQISLESMAHYINIDNFLAENGLSLDNAPETIPEFALIRKLVDDLFDYNDNVFKRSIAILTVIESIARYIPLAAEKNAYISSEKEGLKSLICWTHENYDQRISLEDAAAIIGYSKHYFCKWFKQNTGVNFIQYLKHIRVYNAGKLLLGGKTVNEAGYASGFQNISYFIKCFKEIRGCTPKAYSESAKVYRSNVIR